MKILFLDQFSDLGGAQQCLLELLPAIRRKDWRAVVAAPGSGPLLAQAKQKGAVVARLRQSPSGMGRKSLGDIARFLWELPRLARDIRRLIVQYKIDLVFVNGPRLLLAASLACKLPLGRRRTPLVFQSHSYLKQRYLQLLAAWSLKRVRATVAATCQFVAAPWQARLGEDRVRIVYIGVPRMEIPENDDARATRRVDGSLNVGVIGRICEQKGQEHVLDALRLLYRDPEGHACPIRCIIAGTPLFNDPAADDYFRGLQAMAAALQRDFPEAPPVEFLGWVEPRWVLGQLDLLLVPSLAGEATTRVIPEAFSAGVPVVATRVGGIPELILDGDNGFLVEPASPEQIAQAVCRALDAKTDLGAVAASARFAYEQELALEPYHQQLLELLANTASPSAKTERLGKD